MARAWRSPPPRYDRSTRGMISANIISPNRSWFFAPIPGVRSAESRIAGMPYPSGITTSIGSAAPRAIRLSRIRFAIPISVHALASSLKP